MVGAFNDMNVSRRRQRSECRREFFWCAKGVATALDDKHRPAYGRQVCVTPFVRLPGRMERISQENDAGDRQVLVGSGNLCRNAATHRLPADEDRRC